MSLVLLQGAHKASFKNNDALAKSSKCGCFYCLETFTPDEINCMIDFGATALCPKCRIDSVLGDASGYPITEAFLTEMKQHWFKVREDVEA